MSFEFSTDLGPLFGPLGFWLVSIIGLPPPTLIPYFSN